MSKESLSKKRRFDPRRGGFASIPIGVVRGGRTHQTNTEVGVGYAECYFTTSGRCDCGCRSGCESRELRTLLAEIEERALKVMRFAKERDLRNGWTPERVALVQDIHRKSLERKRQEAHRDARFRWLLDRCSSQIL